MRANILALKKQRQALDNLLSEQLQISNSWAGDEYLISRTDLQNREKQQKRKQKNIRVYQKKSKGSNSLPKSDRKTNILNTNVSHLSSVNDQHSPVNLATKQSNKLTQPREIKLQANLNQGERKLLSKIDGDTSVSTSSNQVQGHPSNQIRRQIKIAVKIVAGLVPSDFHSVSIAIRPVKKYIFILKIKISVIQINPIRSDHIFRIQIKLKLWILQKKYLIFETSMQPQGEQIQQVKRQLVFKEYPSIQLWTRDKVINKIKEEGFDKQNILWVASEKIHGSNFSIHCSEDTIRYGRRTDFLTKEIPIQCDNPKEYFLESFYGAGEYVSKIHNKFLNVFKKLKETYPDLIKFSVYGEYFGGAWPKANDSTCKAVQKGVYYTPYHEFMAFDIKVFTSKAVFWVDVLDIPKFLQGEIAYVPVYKKGTFEQVFQMDTKIDSTIPQLLKLEKLDNNIIEGMVIRPNSNLKIPDYDQRVILKKKNQQFSETATKPKGEKQKKEAKKCSPEAEPYLEEIDKYVNFNRVESLVSKFPDQKNRKKLNDELIRDVITDMEKDGFKWPESDVVYKQVKSQLTKKTMKVLNEYFTKH